MKVRHQAFITLLTLLVVVVFGSETKGQPGGLDSTFSGDGLLSIGVNPSKELAVAGLVQSDGMVVMVGNVSEDNVSGANEKVIVKRYISPINFPELIADVGFGTNGAAFFSVGGSVTNARSAKLQSNGKIVIVGDYWNGTNFDVFITRLNANGTLDYGFGNLGVTTIAVGSNTDILESVAIHTDGKIYAVGHTVQQAGTLTLLVRLNSNGTLDTTFGAWGGYQMSRLDIGGDRMRSLAVQTNGRLVVAGYTKASPNKEFTVARFTIAGGFDSSFGLSGKAVTSFSTVDDEAFAVKVQSDGKIVAVGSTLNTQNYAIVRLTSSGVLDTSFDSDGKASVNLGTEADVAYGLVIQSSGKYLAVGKKTVGGIPFASAVRWNTNGSLDSSFYLTGMKS